MYRGWCLASVWTLKGGVSVLRYREALNSKGKIKNSKIKYSLNSWFFIKIIAKRYLSFNFWFLSFEFSDAIAERMKPQTEAQMNAGGNYEITVVVT